MFSYGTHPRGKTEAFSWKSTLFKNRKERTFSQKYFRFFSRYLFKWIPIRYNISTNLTNQIELCRQYIAMHFGEDAAEKALSNEDEREEHLKCERMPRRVEEAEQRVGVRTPRSADKDTQFSE